MLDDSVLSCHVYMFLLTSVYGEHFPGTLMTLRTVQHYRSAQVHVLHDVLRYIVGLY